MRSRVHDEGARCVPLNRIAGGEIGDKKALGDFGGSRAILHRGYDFQFHSSYTSNPFSQNVLYHFFKYNISKKTTYNQSKNIMPPRAKSAAPAKGKGKDTGDGDYKGGRGARSTVRIL